MDRFGLIGDPIATSKSPALFGAGYHGKYTYELIEGQVFEESWRRFLEGFRAINVTAPFKENAFEQVVGLAREGRGTVSGPAWKIGATNLIVKNEDGSLDAHNSDFTGIILSIAEALFPGLVGQCYDTFGDRGYIKVHQFIRQNVEELYGRRPQALVVGCGGAGKAAAVAAAEMGFSTVLMNKTLAKAQSFALDVASYGFIVDTISDFRAALAECDIVIYTIPVALSAIGELTEDDFRGEGRIPKVILEANYRDPSFRGESLERMQRAGCRYVSGRRWLLYQALTGYGIMTGETPDFEAMDSVVKQ